MIVKIDKLSHDFRGITRVNEKVVFVGDTLPNEVANIKIVSEKKNYCVGKVMNIITKSDDRVDSICPYFNKCGGCSTGYIDYSKSLTYKREIFKDIMKKYANYEVNPEIISNYKDYGYRNKISLKVFNGKLALSEEDSNNLVNIDKCYLVNDNINNVISSLNNINLDGLNEVIIRGTDDIMVILYGTLNKKLIIDNLKDKVESIILNNVTIYDMEVIIFL